MEILTLELITMLIKIQTISSSQSKNLLTADEYADLVG